MAGGSGCSANYIIDLKEDGDLAGHKIDGRIIYPATGKNLLK